MNHPAPIPVMSGAVTDPKVQKIMAYQAAMAEGRIAAARAVFHPDVIYTVPGRSSLAGVHRGPDAVMNYFAKLMALTDGTYAIVRMHWMVSDERVSLHTHNHARRLGRTLEWDEVIVFTFKDGLKSRIDLLTGDAYGVDQFFS